MPGKGKYFTLSLTIMSTYMSTTQSKTFPTDSHSMWEEIGRDGEEYLGDQCFLFLLSPSWLTKSWKIWKRKSFASFVNVTRAITISIHNLWGAPYLLLEILFPCWPMSKHARGALVEMHIFCKVQIIFLVHLKTTG